MQYVFLSHDVDWRKQGAPLDHILARSDRFDKEILENCKAKNPYYNIPEYMDIEDKFGVKSTFFFRTIYENGDFNDYESDIKSLMAGGWEIGLHSDPSSITDIIKLQNEKTALETLTKTKLQSNRVHYLGFNNDLPKKLQELGFIYDSTVKKFKDRIDESDTGFYLIDKLIEFPPTLIDAYLFTLMKIKEEQIVTTFENTLNLSRKMNSDFNIITMIWHDNVLKMKGGRMYKRILEYLASQDDVKIKRGIDLVSVILKNKQES